MVVGYDVNFNFNYPDSNIKLRVLKDDFKASNHKDVTKQLDLEYNSSDLYFGIPILNMLDNSNSHIIGHHFLNDNENKKIGTYIFSYSLKKNHYDKLPNFTFYTLIISNYPNSDNYGISTFQHASKISKLLNVIKLNSLKPIPKFISIYSMRDNNCGPIFLKQKANEIKFKYINVNCNQNDCICKSKKFKRLEDNLKFAFLDPKDSN
jgi:hypothetical protein